MAVSYCLKHRLKYAFDNAIIGGFKLQCARSSATQQCRIHYQCVSVQKVSTAPVFDKCAFAYVPVIRRAGVCQPARTAMRGRCPSLQAHVYCLPRDAPSEFASSVDERWELTYSRSWWAQVVAITDRLSKEVGQYCGCVTMSGSGTALDSEAARTQPQQTEFPTPHAA